VGEKQNEPFQLSFHASLKVDFQGSLAALPSTSLRAGTMTEWALRGSAGLKAGATQTFAGNKGGGKSVYGGSDPFRQEPELPETVVPKNRDSRKRVGTDRRRVPFGESLRASRVKEAAYRLCFGASNNATGPGAGCHFRTGQVDWQGNRKLSSESQRKGGLDCNRSRDPFRRSRNSRRTLVTFHSG